MAEIEGTMLIRAWIESGHAQPLRARLISSHPSRETELVETAADTDAIVLAVRRWLDLLQNPGTTTSA